MERLLTASEMKANDEYTIKNLGFSKEILIERAGTAVAEEITRRFKGGRVLVCVGKGNNGEDGKVVADVLSKIHGFSVLTVNIENGIFKLFEREYDIIVDCIFGTGLNREVEGKYKTAIEKINGKKAFVVSCDIPSGLNGTNGKPMGVCVKANLTVAIQELKLGHFLNDGPDYTGEIVCRDIGMSIWGDEYVKRYNDGDLSKFFPERKRNVNKGCFGKACVFGGSKRYSGSIMLSANALASLKTGMGYSQISVPECLFNVVGGVNPECILQTVSDDGEFLRFDEAKLDEIKKYNAVAFGMGVGVTEENYKIVKYLLESYSGTLIIDADGLNTISKFGVEILKNKKCNVIVTPHILEFSRLTGKSKEEITENAIAIAKDFANEYNVVVLLKNATSVITDGKETFINTTGTSGMAKCGSGDVLSGILAGISARGFEPLETACASSYIFGKAGEKASKDLTDYCVTASDIINALPFVIKSF